MTPLEHYRQDLLKEGFSYDPAQEQAIQGLQEVYDTLLSVDAAPKNSGLFGGLFRKPDSTEPVPGLYFWGGVGRGKTYLMDVFFDCLPFERKLRVHFHRFMQKVHRDLKQFAGKSNPLEHIAEQLASEVRVICFDEFFVSDITDAMLLGGLFEKLFQRGVTLVATSNIPPDQLYKNGLQRQRFLPAIALIKQHTRILNVDSGVDYRLRTLEQAELYHSPLDREADVSLKASFEQLAPEPGVAEQRLEIEGRYLQARYCADDVVWFDFAELCDGPRSQNDYIELARIYHAVLISNVPQFTPEIEDQARRFINLVDEFYDRNVKLVMSAAEPLESLYQGQRLVFEFERTSSRLLEMQSHDYLAREHKP